MLLASINWDMQDIDSCFSVKVWVFHMPIIYARYSTRIIHEKEGKVKSAKWLDPLIPEALAAQPQAQSPPCSQNYKILKMRALQERELADFPVTLTNLN